MEEDMRTGKEGKERKTRHVSSSDGIKLSERLTVDPFY